MKKQDLQKAKTASLSTTQGGLLKELQTMIDQAQWSIASTVNSSLALLYWHVGDRIRREILLNERAEYGQSIVVTLSRELVSKYGNGFNDKNLHRMIQFSEAFPDIQIVVTLSRQLSWSHFVRLIALKDSLKRDFYAEMCRIETWNVRTLRKKIDTMLYERTAI